MNFTDNLFRNGSNGDSGAFGIYAQPLAQTYTDDAGQDSEIAVALPAEHFGGYAKPVSDAYSGWYAGTSGHTFGYRNASDDMGEFGIIDFHSNNQAEDKTGFLNRLTSTKKEADSDTYCNFLTQKNDIPDLPADKPFGHGNNLLTKAAGNNEEAIAISSAGKKYTTGFGYMPSGGFFKGYEL